MPSLPVPHHFLEFAQVYVPCISDAIQPSHPLMPSSPSALNLAQHQGLFQRSSVYIRWPGGMLDFIFRKSKKKKNPTCLLLITSAHLTPPPFVHPAPETHETCILRFCLRAFVFMFIFCLKYHFPCSSKSRYHLTETFGPWSSHIIALLPLLCFTLFRTTFINQN